jgi:folate-dependent tRNA-U54 methylase TrmFO/GidA
MDKVEAVRLALAELRDVPAGQIAALVRERHGLKVAPGIVSVIKAMFQEEELLASFRREQGGAASGPLVSPL